MMTDNNYLVMMRMGSTNAVAHLEPLAAAVYPHGVTVVRADERPKHLTAPNINYVQAGGRSRVSQVFRVLVHGIREAMRLRPALILSFNAFPYGVLAAVASAFSRRPFHVGYVGSDLELLRQRPLWRRLANKASFATTPGASFVAVLQSAGFENPIHTIPHGVDASRFFPGTSERDIDCLFVGALSEVKRVDRILNATALIQADFPKLKLTVVGSGPAESLLKGLASDLGLVNSVHFAGYQLEPERWMRRARIVLFASKWEGLPFALIEAMRCGVVPVACEAGAIHEVVDDTVNGRFLTDCDPRSIASAVVEILGNARLFDSMSKRAVSSSSAFTFESVAGRWRQVLTEEAQLLSSER